MAKKTDELKFLNVVGFISHLINLVFIYKNEKSWGGLRIEKRKQIGIFLRKREVLNIKLNFL